MRSIFQFSLISIFLYSSMGMAKDFYDEKQRGWFWHETSPVQEEIEEETIVEKKTEQESSTDAKEPQDNRVIINTAWLKANMETLLLNAIDNPTQENLSAYYSAQRIMLDMSSRFASETGKYFENNFWLSEEHRRPTEGWVLNRQKRETYDNQQRLLTKIGKNSGLWFFFSSTCKHCITQLPIINRIAKFNDINVLYISLDGGSIQGIPEDRLVFDHDGQMSERFGINFTPVTYLVANDATVFSKVAEGMAAENRITSKIISKGYELGWVSEPEFRSAQFVKDFHVLTNGNIQAPSDVLDKPELLQQILKEKLDLISSPVGTPISPKKGISVDENMQNQ